MSHGLLQLRAARENDFKMVFGYEDYYHEEESDQERLDNHIDNRVLGSSWMPCSQLIRYTNTERYTF